MTQRAHRIELAAKLLASLASSRVGLDQLQQSFVADETPMDFRVPVWIDRALGGCAQAEASIARLVDHDMPEVLARVEELLREHR